MYSSLISCLAHYLSLYLPPSRPSLWSTTKMSKKKSNEGIDICWSHNSLTVLKPNGLWRENEYASIKYMCAYVKNKMHNTLIGRVELPASPFQKSQPTEWAAKTKGWKVPTQKLPSTLNCFLGISLSAYKAHSFHQLAHGLFGVSLSQGSNFIHSRCICSWSGACTHSHFRRRCRSNLIDSMWACVCCMVADNVCPFVDDRIVC